MRTARTVRMFSLVFLVGAGTAGAQVWTPLANQPQFAASNPLLLTDGTVIAHNACSTDWWRLTPDSAGKLPQWDLEPDRLFARGI